MMENINAFKATITAVLAALTALWGWFGWLVLAWVACMAIDVITGMMAAAQDGKWSSSVMKEGISGKVGCVFTALVALIFDALLGLVLAPFPGIALPFDYTVLFCPVVIVWYALAEMGSIVENAGSMGAPVPPWLTKAIAALGDTIDKTVGGDE